jgi:hypothetical protein
MNDGKELHKIPAHPKKQKYYPLRLSPFAPESSGDSLFFQRLQLFSFSSIIIHIDDRILHSTELPYFSFIHLAHFRYQYAPSDNNT